VWVALAALALLPLVLEAAEPVTIVLKRNVNRDRRARALLQLKLRQMALTNPALLEAGDVPLQEEVLSRKHLATYFGEIRIVNADSKATPFKALFDTGSCEFWVPSSECTTQRCEAHDRFPATGRERKIEHSMNIQYLSGKVQGDMIKTEVILGDLKVKGQVVGLGRVVEIDLLDDVEWDGILGLAYPNPTLNAQGVVPLFDNVISQNLLHERKLSNQFAYYIDDEKGAVTFGGANCDLLHANTAECINRFQFVPVTEQTYWTITIRDVRVKYPGQQERSGFCPEGGCKAIVDTGTYLVYGPSSQVAAMMDRSLNGCDLAGLPDLHFDFHVRAGEPPQTVTLKPIDYVLKFRNDGRDECVMGVSPDADTIWTLGQVFLRSFYTVFDRDENRIGFARLPRTNFRALTGVNRDNVGRRHNSPQNNKNKHSGRDSFRAIRPEEIRLRRPRTGYEEDFLEVREDVRVGSEPYMAPRENWEDF
jgi:hypothetical protein